MALMELKNVCTYYGNIQALRDISLSVEEGEIVTLIGANGAGKTTTLMSICGITAVRSGQVLLDGEDISRKSPHAIVAMGLSQVPEGRRIFPQLTVMENLDMGAFFRSDRDGIHHDKNRVFQMFPILLERRKQHGGTLSGGEQQMLAMGRALMGRPRLLLLDEPSLGLAPLIVQQIFRIIREINEVDNVTVVLVEQNANLALKSSSRGYVLETGNVVMEDDAAALLANPAIRAAYLGE